MKFQFFRDVETKYKGYFSTGDQNRFSWTSSSQSWEALHERLSNAKAKQKYSNFTPWLCFRWACADSCNSNHAFATVLHKQRLNFAIITFTISKLTPCCCWPTWHVSKSFNISSDLIDWLEPFIILVSISFINKKIFGRPWNENTRKIWNTWKPATLFFSLRVKKAKQNKKNYTHPWMKSIRFSSSSGSREYFERKCFRWKFKKQIKHILKENTDSRGVVNGESHNSNLIQGKECPTRRHNKTLAGTSDSRFFKVKTRRFFFHSETRRLRRISIHKTVLFHSIKMLSFIFYLFRKLLSKQFLRLLIDNFSAFTLHFVYNRFLTVHVIKF